MRIYNSLTRKKEELKESKIGMYVCGPTVYDEPHIGHARSAYVFDVIVRYLRFKNLNVTFVRNVTDIDDKIIDRARREPGEVELKSKVKQVSEKYLKQYHEDMNSFGLIKPDKEPKATNTIKDMIAFIQVLIKKDFAYEVSGSVYFDVRKFKNYGKLSGQSMDQMEEGSRVTVDKNKKDPLDFALWKASKEDEPFWESPWGKGRPGWHIECSVMSTKFLGNNFLIHGGGLDLIFPHHENEIAQTICAGKKSAKYWIHNGLLTINGQKMAKSLGNFITIKDFITRYKNTDLLKMFFLSSHYRHPVDYAEEKIEEMKKAKQRGDEFLKKVDKAKSLLKGNSKAKSVKIQEIERINKKFIDSMDDDFSTPEALSAIFELITLGNVCLDEKDISSALIIVDSVLKFCTILGISMQEPELELSEEQKALIKKREEARRKKDFKEADEIRKALLSKGIILKDTKEGSEWRRKL